MNSTLNKIVWFILALYPVMDVYLLFSGVPLGVFLLLIILPFSFFYKKQIFVNKEILYLFLSVLVLNTISFVFLSSEYSIDSLYRNNMIWITAFFVLIGHFTSIKPNAIFFSSTIMLSVFVTAILILQFIVYYQTGRIPNFFLLDELRDRSFDQLSKDRPYSIFLEPAAYAIFILPIYYYALVKGKKYIAIFLAFGLLISQSSTAIIAGSVITAYAFYKSGSYKQIALFGLFVMLILAIFASYIKPVGISAFEVALGKINNAEENARLLGNFPLLFHMDLKQLVFGFGLGQMENFMISESYYYKEVFSNTILMSVFNFGILGLISYLWLLFDLYRKSFDKGYVLIIVILSFSAQFLFTQYFFYLLLFTYAVNALDRECYVTEKYRGEILRFRYKNAPIDLSRAYEK